MADLDKCSAVAQQRQRRAEAGRMTRGIDHDVDAPTGRQVANERGGSRVGAAGDERVGGADVGSQGHAWTERVDRDHARRTHQACHRDVHDPDRADADHSHGVAFAEAAGPWLWRPGRGCGSRRRARWNRDVRRKLIGNMEHGCARSQVQVPPTLEQVRGLGTRQRVAIVLEPPAEVVRVVPAAGTRIHHTPDWVPAPPRSPICSGEPSKAVAPPSPIAVTMPTFSWPWMMGNGVDDA